jgi:transmembrane sensor
VSGATQEQRASARSLVEASAWRMHLAEVELDSCPEFEAWLAASEDNHAAWSRTQESWNFFGQHATAPEVLDLRRKALGQARDLGRRRWAEGRWMRRRGRTWGAVAAGLALVIGSAITWWGIAQPDVYRTAAGERRVVTLSDGSQVQLDALTVLRVDYSDRGRDLTLVSGQARFDVAHDVQRPFAVLAARQKVVATGTAFNVDVVGSDLLVTLIEGSVVILPQDVSSRDVVGTRAPVASSASAGADGPPGAASPAPVELSAGQQARISPSGRSTVAPADVQRALAWQSGQLIFDDETLLSAVARINRYSTRPAVVVDEGVAGMRLSGVFNSNDAEGFLGTITLYLPVEALRDGERVRIVPRRAAAVP